MKNLIFLFLFTFSLFAKIYKGAEYRTKEDFTYGKFEVRMKPAGKEGMLASFLPITNKLLALIGMKLILNY